MSLNFTESRDGQYRATVRVQVRIARPVFDWLKERVGAAEAEKTIRDAVREYGSYVDFRTLAVLGDAVEVIHSDDERQYTSEGWDVYPGSFT